MRFDSTAYSPRRKKAVWQNNHFCKLLHWRDRGLGFGKGKYPPYNLIPTATPDHHLQPDAQCRKEEGRNREPLETGSSPSHISFGALDQTPQITSQKRKPKNWTQRVFLSTLILSHWLFPVRPFLAPDIVQGKSYSPSQGVKEKAANQLNRSWNLFIWKSLFFFFCHLRDITVFRNTLLTSFGRRTHLILHDSSLRLSFLISESELLNAKLILRVVVGKWKIFQVVSLGCTPTASTKWLKKKVFPWSFLKQSKLAATSNYYLIFCSWSSRRLHLKH